MSEETSWWTYKQTDSPSKIRWFHGFKSKNVLPKNILPKDICRADTLAMTLSINFFGSYFFVQNFRPNVGRQNVFWLEDLAPIRLIRKSATESGKMTNNDETKTYKENKFCKNWLERTYHPSIESVRLLQTEIFIKKTICSFLLIIYYYWLFINYLGLL